MSSQDTLILLQDTLEKLNQSRNLSEVDRTEQTSELDR
jgi:hypothetical protein